MAELILAFVLGVITGVAGLTIVAYFYSKR